MSTPCDFGRDDKRRRLVVGISCAGADRSDNGRRRVDNIAAPLPRLTHKRHDLAAVLHGTFEQDVGIDAYQLTVVVGVPIACAGHASGGYNKAPGRHRSGSCRQARPFTSNCVARHHLYTNDLAVRSVLSSGFGTPGQGAYPTPQQQRPRNGATGSGRRTDAGPVSFRPSRPRLCATEHFISLQLPAISCTTSCKADFRGPAERTCRTPPWRSRAAPARSG